MKSQCQKATQLKTVSYARIIPLLIAVKTTFRHLPYISPFLILTVYTDCFTAHCSVLELSEENPLERVTKSCSPRLPVLYLQSDPSHVVFVFLAPLQSPRFYSTRSLPVLICSQQNLKFKTKDEAQCHMHKQC